MRTVVYYHRLQFPSESGQTIQVVRDYHALAEAGDTVHLFYRSDLAMSPGALHAALRQYALEPTPRLQFHHIAEGPRGKRRLRRAAHALLQSASASNAVVVCRTLDHAMAAFRLRRRLRARVVLELHETAIPHMVYREAGRPIRAWFSRGVEHIVFRRCDGIIATVPSQLERLEALYPHHAPAAVLPNGVPRNFLETPARTRDAGGKFRLRYAGQLSAWKNTDIMIESLRYLPANVVLDIAGGKAGRETETRQSLLDVAAKFGVAGRLDYVGCLASGEVAAFLAGADALLLPLGQNVSARFFTSPMKLFEYAATAVPMVVTRQPTTESLVRHEQEALLVEALAPQAMARAVLRLMDDPAAARRMGERARAWSRQYTYERRAARLREFLAALDRPT